MHLGMECVGLITSCSRVWIVSVYLLLLCLFSLLASRNVSDWWLAYWISHSGVKNNNRHQVNMTGALRWNNALHFQDYFPGLLIKDQLRSHVLVVKDTVTFYLIVYAGLAIANSVRFHSLEPSIRITRFLWVLGELSFLVFLLITKVNYQPQGQ